MYIIMSLCIFNGVFPSEGLYELLRVAGPKIDVELTLAPEDVIYQYRRTVLNLQDLYKGTEY